MLGVADLILDENERDKYLNLEDFLLGLCLPEVQNEDDVNIEELYVHY